MAIEERSPASAWFAAGENYFRNKITGKSPDITGLNLPAVDRLDQMFIMARLHPEMVEKRAGQVDVALTSFNWHHDHGDLGKTHINSIKLSQILGKAKKLPLIKDCTLSSNSAEFFQLFHSGVKSGTYTFIDTIKESDQLMDHLVTASLIDGYGLMMAKNMRQPNQAEVADLVANAICEEAKPGPLQTMIFELNWYDQKWGFDKNFVKKLTQSLSQRS